MREHWTQNIKQRQEACEKRVFLDGKPAKICGAYNDHASIWLLENPNFYVGFSWSTVLRILGKNGEFFSK